MTRLAKSRYPVRNALVLLFFLGVLGLLALPIVLLYFWRSALPAASAA